MTASSKEIVNKLIEYSLLSGGSSGAYKISVSSDGDISITENGFFDKVYYTFVSQSMDDLLSMLKNRKGDLVQEYLNMVKSGNYDGIEQLEHAINKVYHDTGHDADAINVGSSVYTDWMKNLSENVKKLPFYKIVLPGSHDSGAYKLNMDIKLQMESDWSNNLQNVHNHTGPIGSAIEHFVEKWAVTQFNDVKSQLESGIRYLDLRLAKGEDGKYYNSHTFATEEMSVIYKDIKDFMTAHPEEVVVVIINGEEENLSNISSREEKVKFGNYTKDFFGSLLYDRSARGEFDAIHTSFEDVVKSGSRLIMHTYNLEAWGETPFNRHLVTDHWDRASTEEEKIARFKEKIESYKMYDANNLRNLSLTMTEDVKSVVTEYLKNFLSPTTSLYDLELQTTDKLIDYIKTHEDVLDQVSMVTSDFVGAHELIDIILHHNFNLDHHH